MGYTMAEKILMKNTGLSHLAPGDLIMTRPDMCMVHDIYTPFVVQKLDEMKKISKLLRVPKELSLGYLDSESLIAMNKTPNNTFPVYWYESKGHSHAPFPRRENVKMIRMEKREE